MQLVDVAPGASSSQPYGFALAGTKLFFIANDGKTGMELHMLQIPEPERPYKAYLSRIAR